MTLPNSPPVLAPYVASLDFNSPVWLAVAEHARARIDQLRVKNDGDLDDVTTQLVRGQIRALKELLGLPETVARVRSGTPSTPGAPTPLW